MPIDAFFPARPAATPMVYAFSSTHPDHAGLLKVGYTEQFPSGVIGRFVHDIR